MVVEAAATPAIPAPLPSDFLLGAPVPNLPESTVFSSRAISSTSTLVTLATTASTPLILSPTKYINSTVFVAWTPTVPGTSFLGFQCAEFALPVRASSVALNFDFFAREGYVRPHSVLPLIAFDPATNDVVLLAPVDHFHDQVLAVIPASSSPTNDSVASGELRWGWSGDLQSVPPGFSTTLAILRGPSVRAVLGQWGSMVTGAAERSFGVPFGGKGRYADVSVAKVGLWTDNGAAYWYRREPGMTLPETLCAKVREVDAIGLSGFDLGCVEIDSWFYDHEVARAVTDVGYCEIVPPTGLLKWEPRDDVLGRGGLHALRKAVGGKPLILHARHISSRSSYLDEDTGTPNFPGDMCPHSIFGDRSEGVDADHVIAVSESFSTSGGSSSGDEASGVAAEVRSHVTRIKAAVSSAETVLPESKGSKQPPRGWWVDGDRAHPVGPDLYQRWMAQASDWGAICVEQDWIVELWLGVSALRAVPGRIEAWQRAFNKAAADTSLSLIWCMATPADMALAASLSQVVAVRTCDDYRYATDPSVLWRWHLTVNCLARVLGLWPFKDVFMSSANPDAKIACIDGDPNACLEALLSALSAGPVAVGDRIGHTDTSVVRRTCRADGIIIKPDMPLALLDRSLAAMPGGSPILWADTFSGKTQYLVAIHGGRRDDDPDGTALAVTEIHDLGGCDMLVYDWTERTAHVASTVSVTLTTHSWKMFVVCPIEHDNSSVASVSSSGDDDVVTVIGDMNVYATMGSRRMRVNCKADGTLASVDVLGQPGESINIVGWTASRGVLSICVEIPGKAWTRLDRSVSAGWH
jgi:hypothetical protein